MLRRIAIIGMALIALSLPAQAKYAFQGSVSLQGGWSSNANGSPQGSAGEASAADFFGIVSPSVIFTSALPRVVQRVAYTFSSQLYADHPELASISNRLEWNAAFTPTSRLEMLVGVNASQSQLNTVNTFNASADPQLQVTVPGTEQFVSVGANETLGYAFSPQGRFTQGVIFSAFVPLVKGQGQTYSLANNLGLERLFKRDAFGGQLGVDYTYFGAVRGPVTLADGTVNADGEVTAPRQQLTLHLLLQWRRDFGNFWATQLQAGALMVMRAEDGGGLIAQPEGGLAIRYSRPEAQLGLTYNHGVAPNALVQQTFATDAVTLSAGVPFGRISGVSFGLSAGYSHGRVIDADTGESTSSVDLVLADATLNWSALPGLNIFTRYAFNDQIGDDTRSPAIPSILRHTVMIGLSGTYPTQAAAVVPSKQALRVDRSDAVLIPELHPAAPVIR